MELNAFVRIIKISLFDRITQPENKVTKGTSFKPVTKIVTRLPYKIVQFCKSLHSETPYKLCELLLMTNS